MINTNITNFRKDLYNMVDSTIKFDETINITTKNGNAVLLSEEEYRGMMETIYLLSIPGMKEILIEGMNTPLEECVKYDWDEEW